MGYTLNFKVLLQYWDLFMSGVLLTLNSANSRCFKELLKWGTKEYTDYSEWPVCNKYNTRNRLEESASSSSSTPHAAMSTLTKILFSEEDKDLSISFLYSLFSRQVCWCRISVGR